MKLANLRKYIIAMGFVVVLLVATSLVSVNFLRTNLDITTDLIELQDAVLATNNLERTVLEERIGVSQYVLTGFSGQLNLIEESRQEYDQRWEEVVRVLEDSNPEGVAAVADAHRTYSAILDDVIAAYKANPDDNTAAVIKLGDARTFARNTLFPAMDELDETQLNRLRELTDRERERAARLSIVYTFLSVLSLVVGVFIVVAVIVALRVSGRMIYSISHLVEASDAISRGDLDVPIDVSVGGDMERLAQSIERMRTSLKAAIERLRR
ncbi:MAG: HAMP domain-containing protein [Anaerolineales bacterium]|nr:HAMP domain-containing protein [Anaerolineales bacterium]